MKRSFIVFFIGLSSCIDPYNPPEIAQSESLLVVDGYVNSSGTSKITLSRSQNLTDPAQPTFEIGAEVWVEDTQGNKVFFAADNFGEYYLTEHTFTAATYRLKVRLSNQKEYESDFVPRLTSPEIDEVTWGLTETEEVELKVSTHDDLSSVPGYYRWTFEETWEYVTPYYSSLVFNTITKQPDERLNNITACWRTAQSTSIAVESTSRFNENKVSEFAIDRFKINSERFKIKYSVLVKQVSITADAYNYWKQVKKSNEDLGTIFGPLPSEVISNIRCVTNPNEPVMGFFSMSSITTKRLFIPNRELPAPTFYNTPYSACTISEIPVQNISQFNSEIYLLVGPLYLGGGPIIRAYSYSDKFCVDCRLSGGTNIQPDYWE